MDIDSLSKQFEESEKNSDERHDNLTRQIESIALQQSKQSKHTNAFEHMNKSLIVCNYTKKNVESLLSKCNTEKEKSELLIKRIMTSNEKLKNEREQMLETKIRIMASNEKLIDERDKLLEIQQQQQQSRRSNTNVWDFSRTSAETSKQKSGINIGKAQDTFITAQRTKAQSDADKLKEQAEIRRQNQLMGPKLVECLASYFPSFRNPTLPNTQQILIMCSAIPEFTEETVTRNYTQLLAAYESLSIEQIHIIDDEIPHGAYGGTDRVSVRSRRKLYIINEAFIKMEMSEFGSIFKTDWLTSNMFETGTYPVQHEQGIFSDMPKLFTNLKGIIECFITLIYSFKPDVDPEILNKLQLLKDNEEKYVIEHLRKKTQGLGRRKRKSKTHKKQIKKRKSKHHKYSSTANTSD